MREELPRPKAVNYITKLVLMVFFFGFFLFFVLRLPELIQNFRPTLLDIGLLAFATLRAGRMVAYDLVAEPLRFPFAKTVPDDMGNGEGVEPRTNGGVLGAFGQLVSCPICTGTWVAAVLVYCLYVWPAPTRVFLVIMGTMGLVEFLNSAVEAMCWSSEQGRTQAGINRLRYKNEGGGAEAQAQAELHGRPGSNRGAGR